jgi:hypothetical protein
MRILLAAISAIFVMACDTPVVDPTTGDPPAQPSTGESTGTTDAPSPSTGESTGTTEAPSDPSTSTTGTGTTTDDGSADGRPACINRLPNPDPSCINRPYLSTDSTAAEESTSDSTTDASSTTATEPGSTSSTG